MKYTMIKTLAGLAAVLLITGTASAGQVSTSLLVTTTVTGTCTVNTTAVNFSGYDGSAQINTQGAVTVNCTNGLNYWVSLEGGQYLSQGTSGHRSLANGANYLDYELYQPDGITIWGDNGFNDSYWPNPPLAGTGNGSDQVHTINGELPVGSPVAGTYTDTVNVTVDF